MLGAALQKSRVLGQVQNNAMTDSVSVIRIVSNRNEINNRFPSLSFHIHTASRPYFEVLLTVDIGLFAPSRSGERQPNNFYSSRQDSGMIQAEDGKGIYLVPPVVLREFAQSPSKTGHIYYSLIAYDNLLGENPVLAQSPEQLVHSAPSVLVANDFVGTTLSHILGSAVEKLRTVGPGGKVFAQPFQRSAMATPKDMTRPLELLRPFYDPSDPSTALMSQNNAFSRELEEWFAGVPNTELFPHSAICQLIMTSPTVKGWGTGFYIGTNRILTCAHNLTGMSNVTIIPGLNGSAHKPFSEVRVSSSSWRVAPG